ncbi:tRNA 2-selenouridine(34) synthase MnmH [Cognatiyoonia sp. IB215446]|uniref:tRNA 2-selenouridine(34) synthase MnmH n=1 Tax=Cognatiyoonia sp. IB215446 TaxID=3097355 RepID=UPI002A16DAE7|nr:tRNA 2-selenouridine(34) synthase MnmH [Cognatiyoonia sp. IB215446]MDX8350114.1 tRNA 2-selenouridine(34) synthase MnmH [Cognatiyoonia sp. IB215446]
MPANFPTLSKLLAHGYDDVIDVRSPAEFAEDHIPGAINLPALDNDQRAEVGTVYKQVSPFDARKIGAGMVIRNVASHIEGPLADKDGGWRPLLYCWRGGQRSGVFGSLLKEIGWRAETIAGGYQSFRRLVHHTLYDHPLPQKFVLLDGYTGTAKTALLPYLAARGVQIIDLEELAQHRGSLLGAMPGGQPAQKGFETALAVALHSLDPDEQVIVEAESSKIGKLVLPPSLWQAMQVAPRIVVDAPRAERAAYLAQAYADVLADSERLAQRLAPLRRVRGHSVVDHWIKLSAEGAVVDLSAALITDHYDPAYDKSRHRPQDGTTERIMSDHLGNDGLERTADAIVKALRRITLQ